jgi:hypothetical protein
MATATWKTRCIICNKKKSTLKCGGCLRNFCYNHWDIHRQKLNKQLDEIEMNRDMFRQSLTRHIRQPNENTLIQQIDQWEQNSIKKIQETAEEARQVALKNINEYIHQIEIKLNKLTDQLRESRHEDDFNEIDLRQFQEKIHKLIRELAKLSTVSIRQGSTSFINKIYVHVSGNSILLTFISMNISLLISTLLYSRLRIQIKYLLQFKMDTKWYYCRWRMWSRKCT